MKKMEIPSVAEELGGIFKRVDSRVAKYGELSSEEIDEIIQDYRRKRAPDEGLKMRVVLDTNVLVSALIKTGKLRELLLRMVEEGVQPVLSRGILEELLEVAEDARGCKDKEVHRRG